MYVYTLIPRAVFAIHRLNRKKDTRPQQTSETFKTRANHETQQHRIAKRCFAIFCCVLPFERSLLHLSKGRFSSARFWLTFHWPCRVFDIGFHWRLREYAFSLIYSRSSVDWKRFETRRWGLNTFRFTGKLCNYSLLRPVWIAVTQIE